MSQTQSLSRRYNHLYNRVSKNSKPSTIRLTTSQLLGCKLFSLEGSQNKSQFGLKNREHSRSQGHNNTTHKSQRKTQSVLSRKKTPVVNKKCNNSKTSSKNHSRLQSEATTIIRHQPMGNNDLSTMYTRMTNVLQRYKTREQQWKKQKQDYQLTIQYLVQKLKKSGKTK